MAKFDLALAIGGAAGQGIATPGDMLARLFVRRGLHVRAYNAYQSIIRGGHSFLTIRTNTEPVDTHGDRLDLMIPLNQDTMDRHLVHMGPGTSVIYNSDNVKPGEAADGVQLCPIPVSELSGGSKNQLLQNTVALGVACNLMNVEFEDLAAVIRTQFGRKGEEVVEQNVNLAKAGYDHAAAHFTQREEAMPKQEKPLAFLTGNQAMAMGGAAAGVKFYCAYPMSPATGVLHWMAQHGPDLGIMVRQMEDEIAVACMAIGAAHAGTRTMCATSGGGFALMTEAVGAASMMEVPVVFIDCQRAGPSTGVPTKTEQGDLWQMLGASQGDYERAIAAPLDILDCFNTIPEMFNLTDRYQVPGMVLADLLLSEGHTSVDPDAVRWDQEIDRGKLITEASGSGNGDQPYLRYRFTEDGVSPRAIPGVPGHQYVAPTDEHDEDSTLISDERTNPDIRRAMVEKRARKLKGMLAEVPAPELYGPQNADVTLIGFGSTKGVIREVVDRLNEDGVTANNLQIKWIVPFHADEISQILNSATKTIIVENNHSGQFARYLRSETSFVADAHIRKYDGEPFLPHHVEEGVKAILDGETTEYVPTHEYKV
jgi:2-oxoglutarate ferredoxin oxidoreductase subunit alpha